MASADLSRALVHSYRTEGRSEEHLAALRLRAVAGSVLIEREPGQSGAARVASWLGGVAIIVVALGAAVGNVLRLVVGEGPRFAATGAAVGGAIALLLAPRIAPLLFDQSTNGGFAG